MTTARRNSLRSIMATAWSFRRSEPGRAFADCLRGAWKLAKGMAKAAAKLVARAAKSGGSIRFNDLTQSPVRRALAGQRYAGRRAFVAARTTAFVGG